MKLAFDRGGDGDRILLLLHGLGATRHVWQPMLASVSQRWDGSWIAPDLRGHGASPSASSYALGLHAADIAECVIDTGSWREIIVLGHSMGGMIALALASSWFGVVPVRVLGLGIKVAWTADELAGLEKMAATPVRWFATRDEAVERYLKVAGLAAVSGGARDCGIVQGEQGWRLATDPATASIGAPPMKALIAAAKAPIHLARGETDRLVSLEQLRGFDPRAVGIAGAGHNAMVEAPDGVWDWLSRP